MFPAKPEQGPANDEPDFPSWLQDAYLWEASDTEDDMQAPKQSEIRMPRTVDEGFRDFLPKLTPSSGETDAAKKHRASIKARLERDFDMKRFFRSGSFGNGTSISSYSDVDYFASIPTKNLQQNSSTTLRKVKDSLADRFP